MPVQLPRAEAQGNRSIRPKEVQQLYLSLIHEHHVWYQPFNTLNVNPKGLNHSVRIVVCSRQNEFVFGVQYYMAVVLGESEYRTQSNAHDKITFGIDQFLFLREVQLVGVGHARAFTEHQGDHTLQDGR